MTVSWSEAKPLHRDRNPQNIAIERWLRGTNPHHLAPNYRAMWFGIRSQFFGYGSLSPKQTKFVIQSYDRSQRTTRKLQEGSANLDVSSRFPAAVYEENYLWNEE